MTENFVLEMAKKINESAQQRINRFLELIGEANRLQDELVEILIKAAEIEKEMNIERREMHLPMFEITTLSEEILAHSPYIEAKGSLVESMFDFVPDSAIASLKEVKEIRISAWQICPERFAKHKLPYKICKKSYINCKRCVCSDDGYDPEGYKLDTFRIRQIGVKI